VAGPGRALIGEAEQRRVLDVLRGGYVSRYGPEGEPAFTASVRTLEDAVAQRSGVGYAVATNSGTASLLTILAGLDIGMGDEVIVPGFTFVASISAIVYAGALPLLAEIDETLNLDPADVEQRITPRTVAILAVHMLGNPARLAELRAIADAHDLMLIEDCAQAFGATYRGKPVGSYGIAGAISFNEYKTITCGDGGMVITEDENLYRRCFAFHDQGHEPLRLGSTIGDRPFLGLNFRMTELQAAVLLAQLERLDAIVERLKDHRKAMLEAIGDIPGLTFRRLPDPDGDLATHLVALLPTSQMAGDVARDLGTKVLADSGWHTYANMEHLLAKRTATNRGCPFHCACHPDELRDYRRGMLPRTDDILARAIDIGLGVSDANLGSSWGVTIKSPRVDIERRGAMFRGAVTRRL